MGGGRGALPDRDMTAQRRDNHPSTATEDAVQAEAILPIMSNWLDAGERCVLVTLTGIDGGSPRPLGAQMAVSESGRHIGLISSGCLERDLVTQALKTLENHQPCSIRYGKGSPFLDIVLPCGSGLDVHFNPDPDPETIRRTAERIEGRQACALHTHLESGQIRLETYPSVKQMDLPTEGVTNGWFTRSYQPQPRLLMYGRGPAMIRLGQLTRALGWPVTAVTPDREDRQTLEQMGVTAHWMTTLHRPPRTNLDPWTAVVLMFHDHDWEIPILSQVLQAPGFYVGAQGSHRTQARRRAQLEAAGISSAAIDRVHGPMGLIPGAKSPNELAVSTLAHIMDAAKANGIPC